MGERGGHQIRAPPGEARDTKLYSTFMTPQESFSGEFRDVLALLLAGQK